MLNSYKSNIAVQPLWQNLDWSSKRDVKPSQQKFQADTWVHLLELPNPFSFDEALLLCQQSEDEWVAWIPDHGEAVLNVSQFCAA
ncbi:MAG: hypothetical protein JO235_02165 [Chroococcidiopsidaceae cyanobacterium CP_BM_RX_35]|nr:hypothetical protein [Chroococcidiopsidaceae cyanobacterium CP_BM_RX_35]